MSSKTRIRFGAFELDPQSGELRKHGIRIKLQDQPFRVLVALLEKPGEIVTRTELQQRIWGNESFVDFEHGLSAAVKRLRDALSDSAENPRYVETVARRGYRFIAAVDSETEQPAPVAPRKSPAKLIVLTAGLLMIAAISIWFALNRREPSAPRLAALTSLSGIEAEPAFSPDGRQLAFVWDGEDRQNKDIYVKLVGGETELRLTRHPAEDAWPSWSPDGTTIAFVSRRESPGIYLISALGGPERKLSDLFSLSRAAWTPDGKYLIAAHAKSPGGAGWAEGALYLIPVKGGGSPQPILTPPAGVRYSDPAIGPDGRLAFIARGPDPNGPGEIRIVELSGEPVRAGTPSVIPVRRASLTGLCWTKDGQSLVFSAYARSGGFQTELYRVSATGTEDAARIDAGGVGAMSLDPDIDRAHNRAAFSRVTTQPDIWRWERGGGVSPILKSSVREANPQFSSDGKRVVFESARSGDESAIWIANADGTNWTRVTRGLSSMSGTPRWSPDDRWIAFDSMNKNGLWDIWKVEAIGGPPRRLTNGEGSNVAPSWSRDGKWVYFCSNRSGRDEIWRASSNGGSAEQVTRNGGRVAFESADGKMLYFTKSEDGAEGLYGMPIARGGPEAQLIKGRIVSRGFAVHPAGIHYITPRLPVEGDAAPFHVYSRYYLTSPALPPLEIRFYEFASGKSSTFGEIGLYTEIGFAVSPDGKTFLCSGFIPEADLWMIENFR